MSNNASDHEVPQRRVCGSGGASLRLRDRAAFVAAGTQTSGAPRKAPHPLGQEVQGIPILTSQTVMDRREVQE